MRDLVAWKDKHYSFSINDGRIVEIIESKMEALVDSLKR